MSHRWPARRRQERHDVDDARVPLAGCTCDTCTAEREAQHWDKVGNLFGETVAAVCECGRAIGDDGRCIAYWQCPYAQRAKA